MRPNPGKLGTTHHPPGDAPRSRLSPAPAHLASHATTEARTPARTAGATDDHARALHTLMLRLLGVLTFPFLVGLGAQLAVPLPPDGVPMTLQTLAVVLAALCLGPRLGTVSMLLYVVVGTAGAAIFAGGEKGLGAIVGQTGGYLVGFVLCQPVIVAIIKRPDGSIRGWGAMTLAMLAGHAVIFAIGVPWLAIVNGFGLMRALEGGLYPFIPGAIVKTVAAVYIGKLAAPWASRRIW
ncbi:MAG: biotin transporter BioY [Phycisphaerales bacterium]|nr:MAG: biotin transporter BioY [Phycisphaerales bacterium]